MSTWKLETPCADCPFSDSEAGKHLARSLYPGHMAEIKRALRSDQWFAVRLVLEAAQEAVQPSAHSIAYLAATDYYHQRRVKLREALAELLGEKR